jgi:hypothetical protein
MLSHLAAALEATVLLSTAASLGLGLMLLRRAPARLTCSAAPSSMARAVFHPLAQLLLVCALLYGNQVLFSAFILRAHGGSAAFIARYIPGPWFAIGHHDPLVGFVAQHVGDGRWLSPSLLRVQAFLELPFTMFAYLAVARLLGRRLYATLCRVPVLALAALSFSVTFSIIELALRNPYTNDDLVLRAAACLLVPVYIAFIARRERLDPGAAEGPSGVLGLLAFLAGAGAIAYVVLAIYDAFLLYNLAHLPRYAGGLVMALGVAAAASFAAPRVDAALTNATGTRAPSAAIDTCVSALRAFTILFFVPSLALRYWGAHASAVLCGLLVVGVAVIAGSVSALRRARLSKAGLAGVLVAAGTAFLVAAWAARAAVLGSPLSGLPELVLARGALSFLVVAIVVFRGIEIAVCWASHETKAPADEA